EEEEEGSEGENERARKVERNGKARRSEEAPPGSAKEGFVGRMKRRVSGVGRGQRQGSVVTV
ncbi:MAG: hypothetical protein Q9159_007228, partial [Coniocarpon cinnabarinum]